MPSRNNLVSRLFGDMAGGDGSFAPSAEVMTVNIPYKPGYETGDIAADEADMAKSFLLLRDSPYLSISRNVMDGRHHIQPALTSQALYAMVQANPEIMTYPETIRVIGIDRDAERGVCAFEAVPAPEVIFPWRTDPSWPQYII
jgi:hypothetical protein